jgi:hypothetical protein
MLAPYSPGFKITRLWPAQVFFRRAGASWSQGRPERSSYNARSRPVLGPDGNNAAPTADPIQIYERVTTRLRLSCPS